MKMIALIGILILCTFIIFATFLHLFISETTEEQIGKRALSVANSVAWIPEVREALQSKEPTLAIQEIVTPIQQQIEAEFIVVGDVDSIRYSHPQPEKIGKRMVGEDNDQALLHGETYISTAEGSLGLSIRGKAPVYSEDGEIIGLVSVGFLNEDVQEIIKEQTYPLWLSLVATILLGLIGAVAIASHIKKLLHNMEPEEISQLVVQKEAILQSTHEGIIAVDTNGLVTMMNTKAQQLLFKKQGTANDYENKPLENWLPNTQQVLDKPIHDKEMILGDTVVLINQTPLHSKGEKLGTVLTFREKTELEGVIHELSRVKQYANALRAQTHEFSNKLYTILGFLQLGQHEEAIDFIKKNQQIDQNWEQFLMERISEPMIHAILQGKLNQANERGVKMTIHPDSSLSYDFSEEEKDVLLTVLGNIIENAIEAVKNQAADKRQVSILFTDIGEDMMMEVEDSGPGIQKEDEPYLFVQGYSTKSGSNRGNGLALSQQALKKIGGYILLEDSDLGGACFSIILPKRGEANSE